MVSPPAVMFESIVSHMTRHDSPASMESVKENKVCVAKASFATQSTKESTVSSAQVAQDLGLKPIATEESNSQDGFFDENAYLSRSETTLDGGSSADSCSGGPSNDTDTTVTSSALSQSLKDAMVLDFGVMTLMCFAGSPLKRHDAFDPSVISGHEDASLITIKNVYVKSPQPSPRASPTNQEKATLVPFHAPNHPERSITRLSTIPMPMNALCSRQASRAVTSEDGADDEDIELNCNHEPSTRKHSKLSQDKKGGIFPKFLSSDSKSPCDASTMTSGSVNTADDRQSLKEHEENESAMGKIILKQKPSLSYGHGCFPGQEHTHLDTSTHGSYGDENSTSSRSTSTPNVSQVPNPVVKPSSWNDIFCNINAGMQIFDLSDHESPMGLGCMSPTAGDVPSLKVLDKKTSWKESNSHSKLELGTTCPHAAGDQLSSSSEANDIDALSAAQRFSGSSLKATKLSGSPATSAFVPHSVSNSPSTIVNLHTTEKQSFSTEISEFENRDDIESDSDMHNSMSFCSDDEDENSAFEDLHAYISLQSVEEYFVAKTGQSGLDERPAAIVQNLLESPQQSPGNPVINHNTIADAYSRAAITREAPIDTSEKEQNSVRQTKEEEEAYRRAYYRHRRQLYLESRLKLKSSSDDSSDNDDDDDSEERPFDCDGPTKDSTVNSVLQHENETETNTSCRKISISNHASLDSPSINTTTLHKKQATYSISPCQTSEGVAEMDDVWGAPSANSHDMTAVTSHKEKLPEEGNLAAETVDLYYSNRTFESLKTNSTSSHHEIPGASLAIGGIHLRTSSEKFNCNVGYSDSNRPTLASLTNDPGYSVHRTTGLSLMTDSGNSLYHNRACESSTIDSSSCQPKRTAMFVVTDFGSKHERTTNVGLTTDSENSHRPPKAFAVSVASDAANLHQTRTTLASLTINPGYNHHTGTAVSLVAASANSHHKRTTISSLAADSGISQCLIDGGSPVVGSEGRSQSTTGYSMFTESGGHHSTPDACGTDSESSRHSRTTPSESSASHHRRVDRLNYLKKVRSIKAATNAASTRNLQVKVMP